MKMMEWWADHLRHLEHGADLNKQEMGGGIG
jgi:hypothetical protein